MNSLKELSPMIAIIFAICTAVWAIYKFIHEYSSKQRNHDADQLVKFFSTEEKIIEFKKQPEYVKDAIIKNISYLKGHPFSEIEYLLSNENITLLELRSLLQLKKMNILVWDKSTRQMNLAAQFQEKNYQHFYDKFKAALSIRKLYSTSRIFNIVLFIVYIFIISIVSSYLKMNLSTNTYFIIFITLMLSMVFFEFLLFNKIEKISRALKFKKEKLTAFLEEQEKQKLKQFKK